MNRIVTIIDEIDKFDEECEFSEHTDVDRVWDLFGWTIKELKKMQVAWTTEWPVEPGRYWFYGFRFKDRDRPPEFITVRVHKGMNSVMYVAGASFMYRGEGDYGVWAKLDTPEPPSIPREE